MRVRLTDGTRVVDISTTAGEQHTLEQIETTAARLLAALDTEPAGSGRPNRTPIGFAPSLTLDGTALTADIERADQEARPERYTEWGDDRA